MFATLLTTATLAWTVPMERDYPDKGPGYLGIVYREEDNGFVISELSPGAAAEKAGLLPGDSITRVNGQAPGNREDFGRTILRARAGTSIELEIVRNGGDPRTVRFRLGLRPMDLHFPTLPPADPRQIVPLVKP